MKKDSIKDYALITLSTLLIAVGVYFFKFPNNFTFGGVTGLAVAVGKILPFSPSAVNFVVNMVLLLLGFLFLGKGFGVRTVYSSMLLSISLSAMQYLFPLDKPLTDDPMLELVFAIVLPALGSAILFNIGASSGGTDIVAMILKKYSSINIGNALLASDLLITLSAFFIFDIKTFLFSMLGLFTKSLVIDNVIESINMCKYFNVVCSNPEPICDFIVHKLGRSATVCNAEGAFSHEEKQIIFTVMSRYQAVMLRQYIKQVEPGAFILISNTSEIIGKGFHNV
ncbi:YitT family protein [Anaeromassilibacillus senegalensis]|uniref:YitT family protein n=1 Tax=Anaeromassilibacillus senegalensis TaxID=1673717 RepID=UPI000682F10D|nr:YitT family protein [Anaeromassilibacillus senegalensis]